MYGKVYAYMSATAIKWEDKESDDYSERNGWVDKDDLFSLEENRNDVRPLMSVDESDSEGLAEEIRDILGDCSLWFNNGDGTFYSGYESKDDGWTYTYAVHFKAKTYGALGVVETDWHPESDGGIAFKAESVSV